MKMQVQRADLGMPSGQSWGRTSECKPLLMLVGSGYAVRVEFEYEECKVLGQSAIYIAIDAELAAQEKAPPPDGAPGIRAASVLVDGRGNPMVPR